MTVRELFYSIDGYRNMRMNMDEYGGANVWRFRHPENGVYIRSNMVARAYKKKRNVGGTFRLSGTKTDIVNRLDSVLAVLNLED